MHFYGNLKHLDKSIDIILSPNLAMYFIIVIKFVVNLFYGKNKSLVVNYFIMLIKVKIL